jgi:amino acid adenylation domain-containing protein
MKTLELLSKLRNKDIEIRADGDRLRYNAPKGALTPDLRKELAVHKSEIIAFLRQTETVTRSVPVPLKPVSGDGDLPLSFAQQRLWFLDQLEGSSSTYNISQVLHLRGGLNVSALRRSFVALVERHQSFRMCFPKTGDGQVEIREVPPYDPLETIDLSDSAEDDRAEAVQRFSKDKAMQPFDLERGPLLRVTLLVVGKQDWMLLLNIHHIVFDGWSFNILKRELSQLYSAFAQGEVPAMEPLTVQYTDYAAWQRQWLQGETLRQRMAFWEEYLAGIPELIELPTDSPRPAVQQHQGAAVPIAVDRECTEGLRQLAQENGCTLFMVLQAALAVVILRFSGCRDIVIGTPVASRPRRELEGLIGLFVDTLVLRTRIRDEDSFVDLLAHVRRSTLDAYAHQELPFELLVERLNPKRSLSHHPVFQVMLNLFNVEPTELTLPGVQIEQHKTEDRGQAKFDINLFVVESAGGLSGRLYYDASLFRRETMVFFGQCLKTLLKQAAANATRPLITLSLLGDEWWREVANIQARQPCRAVAHPSFGKDEVTLVERFLTQVERYPHHLAVVAPDQRWTYRQLDERARQLAAALLAGPPRDPWSALLLPHDAGMVVGILGSLMAGRAYLPLDAAHPDARLQLILADTQAKSLVCNGATRDRAQALMTPETVLIDLDFLDWEPAGELASIDPDAPAYLLHTSGSTGRPKGVMQTHKNVLHFIREYSNQLRITHQDRLLQLANYTFDGGVVDCFSTLLNGATLCPFDMKHNSLKACIEWIERERITVYHSVPTVFRELVKVLDRPLDTVQLVVLGGEPILRRDFLAWRNKFSADCFLINFYGQTESSVNSVHIFDKTEIERERVPMGFPVDETKLILTPPESDVDAQLFGEIVIQSTHLAAGYWQRDSDAFTATGNQEGEMRYRTGDLARRLPDGSLEFLGRVDHQVKIRGFRIELGEIESVLSAHLGVKEAVVLAREDRPDDRRLVAYVVLDERQPADVEVLRRALAEQLPDYMIPNAFVPLDSLPFKANGKVDRLALPAPELDRSAAATAYVAPSTPLEETLAELWQEVLRLNEPPGIHDNFFELGGHSLMATQIISRLSDVFQVEIPLRQLFLYPTIAELALIIAGKLEKKEQATVKQLLDEFEDLSDEEAERLLAQELRHNERADRSK